MHPLAGLAAGPDLVGRLDQAVLDRDDRLDREERADRRLGAADPAAPLQVLERVERDEERDVAPARPRGRAAISAAGRPPPPCSTASSARSPSPIEAPLRVDDVDLAVRAACPAAISALLIVPDSVPATWIETIASAPAGEGRLEGRLEVARATQAAVVGNGASGAVIRSQNSPVERSTPALNDSAPKLTTSGTTVIPQRRGLRPGHVRRRVGDDGDVAHSGSSSGDRAALPRHDTGRVHAWRRSMPAPDRSGYPSARWIAPWGRADRHLHAPLQHRPDRRDARLLPRRPRRDGGPAGIDAKVVGLLAATVLPRRARPVAPLRDPRPIGWAITG